LGTGFGLRYDLSFVDFGFKTYNPANEPGEKWFREYNFANSVLNFGINYLLMLINSYFCFLN
jgi:hypothetical protein